MSEKIGEGERGPKLVAKEKVKCPVCGSGDLEITLYAYRVPFFGDVILETGKCSKCGYRWSDVGVVSAGRPKRIVVEVSRPKDLNALVIKSARASIRVPELGIEVTPGPAAKGYITTVEGVLQRVLDHVPSECFKRESSCYGRVKEIEDAIKGLKRFRLIIEDPTGKSAVRGEGVKVVEEPLKDEDARAPTKRGKDATQP